MASIHGREVMEQQNTLHWLHISDYHSGQKNAKEYWPQIRRRLYENIKSHCETVGAIDLVIFSGDIAFKGDVEEYNEVKKELVDLWAYFSQLNQTPKLFIVPGNHDLVRPSDAAPLRNVAQLLRCAPAVKNDIFNNQHGVYRKELDVAFESYKKFVDDIGRELPLLLDVKGVIPGDVSGVLDVNGLKVGVIGLNSAWTHLADGDLKGKLDIYVEQANSVANGDLPAWTDGNHLNLLVTHHPVSWFNPEARSDFNSEIFVADLFDAHLFGHMHDNLPEVSVGASGERRAFQVASLFGLEKVRGQTQRKHGFFFVKVDANLSTWTIWPRIIEQKQHGWDLGRDGALLKGDEISYTLNWKARRPVEKILKK